MKKSNQKPSRLKLNKKTIVLLNQSGGSKDEGLFTDLEGVTKTSTFPTCKGQVR